METLVACSMMVADCIFCTFGRWSMSLVAGLTGVFGRWSMSLVAGRWLDGGLWSLVAHLTLISLFRPSSAQLKIRVRTLSFLLSSRATIISFQHFLFKHGSIPYWTLKKTVGIRWLCRKSKLRSSWYDTSLRKGNKMDSYQYERRFIHHALAIQKRN